MLHTSTATKRKGRMEKSLLLNLHIGGEERKIRRAVVRGTEFWGLVRGERNINRREKHGLKGVGELEERIGLLKAKYLLLLYTFT